VETAVLVELGLAVLRLVGVLRRVGVLRPLLLRAALLETLHPSVGVWVHRKRMGVSW
jgi:hypothetical protein